MGNLVLIRNARFFVAIPPSMRTDWGKQMTKLVKPGGYLIALIYPMDEYNDHGPPYYVRPEHYAEYLSSKDWEKLYEEVPKNSSETHKNREKIVVWKRLS